MDEELKRTIEAILFAAGRKLELSELAKLCRRAESEIISVLEEWRSHLDSSNSPTMLVQDGSGWKLTVREKYAQVIKKVVTKTELPKGHMETLAVVAYKAPVLQSKVVKIRTNKAYDHLAQLEDSGFITREKSGRSKLIKLTPKFFEYFDIDPSKLKQKFASSGDVEKAIEAKEIEIEQIGVDQRKQTEERLEKPQIVLQSDSGKHEKLETYPVVQPSELLPTGVEIFEEKVGDLPVYDVPLESIPAEERPPVEAAHPHHRHHKKKPHKAHPHVVHHPREHVEPIEQLAEEVPAEVETAVEAPVETEASPEAPAEAPAEVPGEAPVPELPVPVKVLKEKKEKKPSTEVPEEVIPELPKAEEKPEEVILTPAQQISKEGAEKAARMKGKSFESGKGLFPKGVSPEMEAKIEERIKRILSGEPEEEKEE
jgi:segregation and condensation protein B